MGIHGLPPQIVIFERRKIGGVWKLITHGDAMAVGAEYQPEKVEGFKVTVEDVGWYFVHVQVATGGETTSVEMIQPAAECLAVKYDWIALAFNQVETITPDANGEADPTVGYLARKFQPANFVGGNWMVKTEAENADIGIEIHSGIPNAEQPLLLAIWKLHDGETSDVQQDDVLNTDWTVPHGTYIMRTGITLTRLTPAPEDFHTGAGASRVRYSVVGTTSSGSLAFNFTNANGSGQSMYVARDYSHELRIKIASIAGETTEGQIRVRVLGGAGLTAFLDYEATEAEYVYAFSPASTPINSIIFDEISTADRFEIEAVFRVTD